MLFKLREKRAEERKRTAGADIQIGSRLYKVKDISAHGLYVAPYEGPLMPGERFKFRLLLVLADGPQQLDMQGVVARFDRGGMGVRFSAPKGQDQRTLLRFLRS